MPALGYQEEGKGSKGVTTINERINKVAGDTVTN